MSQRIERRCEEIFTTFLFNPWHVTEFKVLVFLSIVDTECPVITDSAIFLANDRIDTRTMFDTLCRKDFVACPALMKGESLLVDIVYLLGWRIGKTYGL